MKLLKDILYKAGIVEVKGSTNVAIEKIVFDSRKIEKLSLFIAIKGTQVNGHKYINTCIEIGAVAVICEVFPEVINEKTTYIQVKDSSSALGIIAANFYDNPSEKINLIGITGTNGKTTCATLLHDLFKNLGYKTGLLSTIENRIGSKVIPSTHTTPNAIELNELLVQMLEERCTYCFMEVSSHAIIQGRVDGLQFKIGVFTNITHDHLDYHKTFDAYITAKKRFFDQLPKDAIALTNSDAKQGMVMLQNCVAKQYTYGLNTIADFKVKIIENQLDGLLLNIEGNEVWTKIIGKFNAYNLVVVYAVTQFFKIEKIDALTAISQLTPVEGRFQCINGNNKITGIIDYAHTPDALKNVLSTIADIRTGNKKVITVVGCGGNRDKEKRPIMAEIAARMSNKVVFTSDNPRNEDPEAILNEMLSGLTPAQRKNTLKISNREDAIRTACALAESGDIILVAGKGHEKYQEINGQKLPFDDKVILKEILEPK